MFGLPVRARSFLAALVIVAAPSIASAESRTGSFDISVTIPPFAAALAATADGAVGESSLDQPGGGLMVLTPDSVSAGSQASVSVFSLVGTNVTARVAGAGPHAVPTSLASISTGQTAPFKGMAQTTFTVVPNSAALAALGQNAPVVSVVVTAL